MAERDLPPGSGFQGRLVALLAFLFLSSCEAPSEAHQFWWNWGTSFGATAATLAAVGVALYLGLRKPTLPKLKLKVLREEGERTTLNSGEDVHYYHLEVRNEERAVVATMVQVYFTVLQAEQPDGSLKEVWRGNLPLNWRDQKYVPRFQKIGAARDCDLCCVRKLSGLALLPLFMPNSLLPYSQWTAPCRLILSIQVRSNQADSDMVRVEISWKGTWAEDMRAHLQVKIISSSPAA